MADHNDTAFGFCEESFLCHILNQVFNGDIVHSGLHRHAGTEHAFAKTLQGHLHTALHADPYSSTSSVINTLNSMVSVCMLLICCHLVTPACLSHTVT